MVRSSHGTVIHVPYGWNANPTNIFGENVIPVLVTALNVSGLNGAHKRPIAAVRDMTESGTLTFESAGARNAVNAVAESACVAIN